MRLVLFLCLFNFLGMGLRAQEIRTHTDGSKIIVYPDGSARYFNTNELVKDYNSEEGNNSYPVVAVTIEPLASDVPVSEEDLKQIAYRKLQLAEEAFLLAQERAAASTSNRQQLEKRLNTAKSTQEENTASQLQRQLLLAKKVELEAAHEQAEAENKLQAAKRVIEQKNYVEAYQNSRKARRALAMKSRSSEDARPSFSQLLRLPQSGFTGYGKTVAQTGQLPQVPCQLAYEGDDEETGQHIRYSEAELLFTHTDESLRPYLEGKEYLTAKAAVQSKGGYRYLQVRLTFANPNAIQTYGYLDKGSLLVFHLLDGNFLHLRSAAVSNGVWDEVRRELYYDVSYPIDRSMISTLRQSDLDYIQLFWSSGFEEYDIYQVDVLQRLLNCL